MKKLTQKAVKIALWEAIERLIPAYCDAVAPTTKEFLVENRFLLLSDEDNEMFDNLQTARSCELLRELRKTKTSESAVAAELAALAVAAGLEEPEPPKSKTAKKAKSAAAGSGK